MRETRHGADLSYEAFRDSRERFLAALRADSEVRRLEALWRTESLGASAANEKATPERSRRGGAYGT